MRKKALSILTLLVVLSNVFSIIASNTTLGQSDDYITTININQE